MSGLPPGGDAAHTPFLRTLRILPLYWRSSARVAGAGLALMLLAMGLGNSWTNILVTRAYGAFFDGLQKLDAKIFWAAAVAYLAVLLFHMIFNVTQVALQSVLVLHWRRWLTAHLIERWLSRHAYYRIERDGIGDNPDQRIQEDAKNAIEDTVSLTIGVIIQLASSITFSYLLWTLGGAADFDLLGYRLHIPGYLFWAAVIFAIAEIVLTQLVGWNFVTRSIQVERSNADFRYDLVQVRDHAEQIGLYSGEPVEELRLADRFRSVWLAEMKVIWLSFRLNLLSRAIGNVHMVVPFLLLAPKLFDRSITFGNMMAASQAWTMTIGVLTIYATYFMRIARWRGSLARLSTFLDAIDRPRVGGVAHVEHAGGPVGTHGLTLATPNGTVMAEIGDIVIAPARRLLVRGPSGSGKSTLLRTFAGLWEHGKGAVDVPPGASTLFLPQKPFLPNGVLRDSVVYPGLATDFDDVVIAAALRRCRLPDLADRLDAVDRWSDRLSPGEQQRVAFARVLLHRPHHVFLDEATSALDPATERAMYELVLHELPDTTIVSVAHRDTLTALHDDHLDLGAGSDKA